MKPNKISAFYIVGNIRFSTSDNPENAALMTDKNNTTCLQISGQVYLEIIANVYVEVPVSDVSISELSIVIEIDIQGVNCSIGVFFYRADPLIDKCRKKNTNRMIGKSEPDIANSSMCYYRLPVECRLGFPMCKFEGFIAIKNTAKMNLSICEIQQG